MSVWQAANAAGIDSGNLGSMERGKKPVSLEAACRLAHVYEVSLEVLVHGCVDEWGRPV